MAPRPDGGDRRYNAVGSACRVARGPPFSSASKQRWTAVTCGGRLGSLWDDGFCVGFYRAKFGTAGDGAVAAGLQRKQLGMVGMELANPPRSAAFGSEVCKG
jgi:hypothetical protein